MSWARRSRRNTPDFSKTGLPTTTALARKVWQAAKIQGHRDPFGKKLLDYTVAELDFVLEMEALDKPDEYVFERGGIASNNAHVPHNKAAWASVLRGTALAKFFSGIPFGPVAAYHARQQAGAMMPGIRERVAAPLKQ